MVPKKRDLDRLVQAVRSVGCEPRIIVHPDGRVVIEPVVLDAVSATSVRGATAWDAALGLAQ